MPDYDFRNPRLYAAAPLAERVMVPLAPAQAHYLLNVMRLRPGDRVLVFNGRDGEWSATMTEAGRRQPSLRLEERTRPQSAPGNLHYLFAPLKQGRLDYMVQKAVEMGASRLQPVVTRHSQVARLNTARMHANAIEAAEQCGILNLPEIGEPLPLPDAIAALDRGRLLVFCDEAAENRDPVAALAAAQVAAPAQLAVLVGPEGGFHADERALLLRHPRVVRLALGPRILRADTAAVAALAVVQATLGDWR